MKKKRIPAWKHEERMLKKVKSRKLRKKSKTIGVLDSKPRYEHQKSRAKYIE
jgi:hypothetical protein